MESSNTRRCGHPQVNNTSWCPDCALAEDEASRRERASQAPVPQSEPLTDERDAFDKWASHSGITAKHKLWMWNAWSARAGVAQTATPQGEPVAQYQVCRRTIKPTFWHNCPGEIEFMTALASGLYEGRKLYAAPPSSDGREPKEQT